MKKYDQNEDLCGMRAFVIIIITVLLAICIVLGCIFHNPIKRGLRVFKSWLTGESRYEEVTKPPESLDGEETPPTSEENGENTDEETPPVIVVEKYGITYYGVIDGEKTEIPDYMYLSGTVYPTEYEKGQGTSVPALREYYPVTDLKDIAFDGWYLDEECTQAFDGVISAESTGDITLYAKLVYWQWTPNY